MADISNAVAAPIDGESVQNPIAKASRAALAPLAPFGGAPPPAPDWFKQALGHEPERRRVPVAGANIELLTWGEIGRPGLMLAHGFGSSAHWWAHIAPLLSSKRRVAAVSLSGMGDSDWRASYDFPTFAEELFVCAQAAGLYESAVKPVFAGHSFGASPVLYTAVMHPERIAGAVVIDAGFKFLMTQPEMDDLYRAWAAMGVPAPPMLPPGRPHKVYATFEEAVMRWRLAPLQPPGCLFVADHIARTSLKPVQPGRADAGWTWKFDPFFGDKFRRLDTAILPPRNRPSVFEIAGEGSALIERRLAGIPNGYVLPDMPSIVLPNAQHHVMVDQPLALAEALETILAGWQA